MERNDKAIKIIKWPYSRLAIDSAFEELSNLTVQKKFLEDGHISPYPYWGWLLYHVWDEIYSQHDLHEYNPNYIGDTFYDEHEAKEIYKFCKWVHDLIDEIGREQPDSAYLNHPEWPNVIKGAKEVYDLMQQNNEKYDYGKWLDIFNYEPYEQWLKRFE